MGNSILGCKLISEKGKINAFTAESRDSHEYLVEKIVTVDAPVASGYIPTGNAARLDRSAPGSAQMLSQSLDSIGVCYWYAKFPKSSIFDSGFRLDFPDGTPNMGVRNNIIARAGVPLTANAISMGEVLLSMREAGGELASLEQKMSESTLRLHEVLWNSAGAAGITSSALASSNTALAAKLSADARQATSGLITRLAGSGSVASQGLMPGQSARISTKVVHASDPRIRTLAAAFPGKWDSMLADPNEYFQMGTTTVKTQSGLKQAVTVVVSRDGSHFFSATKPGDMRRASNYAFQKASLANKAKLASIGFTDSILSASILNQKLSTFRRLGIRNAVIPLRANLKSAAGATQKVLSGAAQAGKTGATNVMSFCKGSAKKVAFCSATLGAIYAGTHWALASGNQAQVAANEDLMAARMENILSNPQTQQNFAAVTAELEKNTQISPELMESFRKILAIKSARSQLGSCSQLFGTELLSTPGVAESGYDPESATMDVATFSPSSAPTADKSAFKDIPEFMPPEETDPSDLHTSDETTLDESIPSADILDAAVDSTSGGSDDYPSETSSDDFGPSPN